MKKEGENYHTSETEMSSWSIFSASVQTNPQDFGVMYEKTTNSNPSHFQSEIFFIYIHFENVSMQSKTFVATSSPRNNFWSEVCNELCCKYCMPLKHEVFHVLFSFNCRHFLAVMELKES